jgi:chemotaxis protein methyltransferase CheR
MAAERAARSPLPRALPGFESIRRWYNATGMPMARILPGEYYVTREDEVIDTVLGSCVAACIRNPRLGIGGMNHFMLPEAMQRNAGSRRIRIWSAGCSTGEEPYSAAMVAADVLPTGWDLKILATDIDSEVIGFAQQGIYPLDRVASLTPERLRQSFQKGVGLQAGKAIVKAQVRATVTYRVLNLLHARPMHGPFDLILCRNEMIYFDQATRERLVERFAQMLVPGGYLCIGHSESIHNMSALVRPVGRTIYRKTGDDEHGG